MEVKEGTASGSEVVQSPLAGGLRSSICPHNSCPFVGATSPGHIEWVLEKSIPGFPGPSFWSVIADIMRRIRRMRRKELKSKDLGSAWSYVFR